jgi:hypothetical protein
MKTEVPAKTGFTFSEIPGHVQKAGVIRKRKQVKTFWVMNIHVNVKSGCKQAKYLALHFLKGNRKGNH